MFWNIESQTGLYVFFKRVCDLNNLLPAENYKLPPEAEGLDPTPSEKEGTQPKITAIAKPPARDIGGGSHEEDERDNNSLHARRSNTTRHSSRPSTGSFVTTVIEEREDENSDINEKLKSMQISAPDTVEEESGVEVPVIVDGGLLDGQASAPLPQIHEPRIDIQETDADETTESNSQNQAENSASDVAALEHKQASASKESEDETTGAADGDSDGTSVVYVKDVAAEKTEEQPEVESDSDAKGTSGIADTSADQPAEEKS